MISHFLYLFSILLAFLLCAGVQKSLVYCILLCVLYFTMTYPFASLSMRCAAFVQKFTFMYENELFLYFVISCKQGFSAKKEVWEKWKGAQNSVTFQMFASSNCETGEGRSYTTTPSCW